MREFLLGFYILFFSTGFMGGTALFVLGLRVQSRLLKPLLAFQLLYMSGMGMIVVYLYMQGRPGGMEPALRLGMGLASTTINAAVYLCALVLLARMEAADARIRAIALAGRLLAGSVIVKSLLGMVLAVASDLGAAFATSVLRTGGWSLAGYILSGLAIAAFGLAARAWVGVDEPRAIRALLRAYGLCALVFAPLGLLEYVIESAGLSWLPLLSTDHVFFLAWNVVSMSAAIRLLKPELTGSPAFGEVPAERVAALGLSAREIEMAVLIARGLANKEIAAELGISPATVRTHIYNLYQKAGARSRVELINKLRA